MKVKYSLTFLQIIWYNFHIQPLKKEVPPLKVETITIKVKDQSVRVLMEPTPMDHFMTVMFTALLHSMLQAKDSAPPDHKESVTGEIYDAFNRAASRVLEAFAPEIEMRPDLTERAILEAENQLIAAGEFKELQNPNPEEVEEIQSKFGKS